MQLACSRLEQRQKKSLGINTFCLTLVASLALAGCTMAPVQGGATSTSATGSADTALASPSAEITSVDSHFYGSKTPYHPFQEASSYSAAPDGFEPVFVENLARHGSRLLSSKKYDDLTYQLWSQAKADNALTELGSELGPEVLKLIELNEKLGYGNLTERGAVEHQDMAKRTYARHMDFFDSAVKEGSLIQIVNSGKDRAVESGQNFANTLAAVSPDMKDAVQKPSVNEDLLYFHASDINADYQEYKEYDPRIEKAMKAIEDAPKVRAASRHLLEQLYTVDFVDRIEAGEFDFIDHGKGKTHLNDLASAVDCLYNLYAIAPGITAEGDLNFDRFIPAEDAETLAYLVDAKNFYEKGPGFEGDDITYRMADVLVDDFFDQVQQKKDGNNDVAAHFRFAHAETVMPFVAALGLEGSTVQATEDTVYSYDNNPWRGETVSPMAANIQWDVYADGNDTYAVRMLYNEKEASFKNSCEPMAEGSFFYDFEELKRCYDK